MTIYHVKQNDTKEPLASTLTDSNGNAVVLTGATVVFHMRIFGAATSKVSAAATIVSATLGQVKYTWTGTDLDTPGEYEGEFQVAFSDATIQSFPNAGGLIVFVHPEIA